MKIDFNAKSEFNNSTKDLGSFLYGYRSNPLVIPSHFQRDYSWGKEQILPLLEEIVEQFEKGGTHGLYLNKVVVSPISDTEQLKQYLIDGQQRLTTLIILLSEIARKSDQISPVVIKDNPVLRYEYEGDTQGATLQKILSGDLEEGSKDTIAKGYRIIKRFLGGLDYTPGNFKSLLEMVQMNLRLNIETVPADYAMDYFDDLNNKGKHLSTIDTVKTYLSKILKDSPKRFSESWYKLQGISKSIGTWKGVELAIRFELSLMDLRKSSKIRENASLPIDKWVKTVITTGEEASKFLDSAATTAERIAELSKNKLNCITSKNGGKAVHRILPALIALEKKLNPEKLFRKLDLVSLTIKNEGRNQIEYYNKICNIIATSSTDLEVSSGINSIIKDSMEFSGEFNVKPLRYGQTKTKNLLLYIEAILRSKNKNSNFYDELNNLVCDSNISIEHISPKSSELDVTDTFGNLTLLHKNDNSKVGNNMDSKYEVYSKSASDFLLTKILVNRGEGIFSKQFNTYINTYFRTYSKDEIKDFGREQILQRQKELIYFIDKEIYGK